MAIKQLVFNGVNGATGEYGLPPMTGKQLSTFICGEATPANLAELRAKYNAKTAEVLGVAEGIDPKKLDEAGWGIIFAHDADPAIKAALGELIALRKQQAGDTFRLYEGPNGFRRGKDTKSSFLARHGAGPGPVDPRKVPYYLLIVGSPDAIPYSVQYQLDVQYAVGRICFDTPQEYANYASSVVAVEKRQLKLPRSISFFGVANDDDSATQETTNLLIEPLYNTFKTSATSWQLTSHVRADATKAQLKRLLGGDQTPTLLFTGSHGMEFPLGDARQIPQQGALLCQDWPGPEQWRGKGAIPQDFYFAGDDLSSDANLLGLMVFHFACHSAGTPLDDEFSKQAFKVRTAIAEQPFVAQLPARMLSHPGGGALAAIGHVERAWSYSFDWPGAGAQTTVFESTLKRLMQGHPIGSAIEYFNERWAELATVLSDTLEQIELGKQVDPYELANIWTTNNDARSYVIVGDPAVRLPLAQLGETPDARPTLSIDQLA